MPDALVGDPARLRQVLVNLVGNAIKFTEKGEVVVEVKVLDGRPEVADPQANPQSATCTLQFSVSDTGVGIPADKQERIFEAFTQADGSTSRRHGGMAARGSGWPSRPNSSN